MLRHPLNPIITRRHIPNLGPHLRDVSSVFNPGAVRFGGTFILLLRVQNRGRETSLMVARSENGVDFEVVPEQVVFQGLETVEHTVYHLYDPRITRLDDRYFIMMAMDTDVGCRLGLAETEDFVSFHFRGMVSEDDNRNGVLFPRTFGGRYLRLDRPNKVRLQSGVTTGCGICLSSSQDLVHWRSEGEVLAGRFHYWDELIGAGPPPILTDAGWLLLYHGVATHLNGANLYQAGVALLDGEDPSRVLARGRYNILEPREPYELMGQVPNVVFPSGWIVETETPIAANDAGVFVYYGAADTSVCLATTTVAALIQACYEE